MGARESGFFRDSVALFGPIKAAAIMADPEAIRLYHLAYFGFRGFDRGVEAIDWDEMRFWRIQFLEHMRTEHGVEWRFTPEDWAAYKQIYVRSRSLV